MFNIQVSEKIFHQTIKFCIVGVFGVFINYCIFILALVFLEIHYIIFSLLGYLLRAVPIFFLNRYWIFKSNVSILKGFLIYIVINLISMSSHSFNSIHFQRIFWCTRNLFPSLCHIYFCYSKFYFSKKINE